MVASHTPLTGDLACSPDMCPGLTGDRTGDLWVRSLALSPLSHTSQGSPLSTFKNLGFLDFLLTNCSSGHKSFTSYDLLIFLLFCGCFHFFFFKDFIYLFLERGEGREKEGEKHQCVVASHAPPTRDLARNPGMCQRLGIELATLWFAVCAQSTGLHQPGLKTLVFKSPGYIPRSGIAGPYGNFVEQSPPLFFY